jgi:mucin-2
MPEEHETIESRSSASQEVYQQTKFMAWFEKAFPWLLVGGAALGLVLMICLPVIFFQEKTAEQLLAQSNLRLALLYTTGGVIAALGLLETYRKNTNDRAKANADIKAALKNQDHQTKVLKEQIRQFDENAFKERKAERRERYTKAVEQLGDEKAPIRMGGVYTLVGLVDEWLEEKSLSDDERFKEGQVIINNLCAYIRSPFTLASHYDELSQDSPTPEGIYKDKKEEFYIDKAILDSEADVRLSIINQIHKNIQWIPKNSTEKFSIDNKFNENKIYKGSWSIFEYNFSGSVFFYDINFSKSYWENKLDVSNSKFLLNPKEKENSKISYFSESIYNQAAYFRNCLHKRGVEFNNSVYKGEVDFGESSYDGYAAFNNSTYYKPANLDFSVYNHGFLANHSTYHNSVYFHDSIYKNIAAFNNSKYYKEANFSNSIYLETSSFTHSTYEAKSEFHDSIYYEPVTFGEYTTYNGKVDFSNSIYHSEVLIGASLYKALADFRNSMYIDKADFSYSAFHGSHYFDGSVFYKSINLYGSVSKKENPQFTYNHPTYTGLRAEYDNTNQRTVLLSPYGNNFNIFINTEQATLNISDVLSNCVYTNSLEPEQKEEYREITSKISNTMEKFKTAQNVQDKDKYLNFFREENYKLSEWRNKVTTITIKDGLDTSSHEKIKED